MRHEVINLSEGWAGTSQTVETIMRLVDDSLTDPLVVTTAQNIVRNVAERDRMAELRAVSAFVRSKMRYTNESIETLKTPRLMVQEIQRYGKAVGDCDDSVILWMALLKSVGHRVRATVISQRRDKAATHIYAEDFINGQWVSDDTIVKNKPLGWSAPAREKTVTRHYAASMGGIQMRDYLQVGSLYEAGMGRRRPPVKNKTVIRSPFARFTLYDTGVRQEALSDFLPTKDYFSGAQVRPFIDTKMGGMITVNEWGMGESVGFIPGSMGEIGKKKKSFFKKFAPLLKKALPIAAGVVGGGVIATLAIKAAKAAAEAAKKKKDAEKQKKAAQAEIIASGAPADAPAAPAVPGSEGDAESYAPPTSGGGDGGDGGSGGPGGSGAPTPSSAAETTQTYPGSRPRRESGGGDNTLLYVGGAAAAALLLILVMGRK